MRVGIDLDGVCYDWTGTVRYLFDAHWDIKLPEPEHWDAFQESVPKEAWRWLWTEGVDLGLFRYGNIIRGAVDGLVRLKEMGHELEVVTQRPASAVQDTMSFIARLPDVFSGVHLMNSRPKSQVGLDLYIDDSPHVVADLREHRLNYIVFDQPWNQQAPGLRIYGWPGVVGAVKLCER